MKLNAAAVFTALLIAPSIEAIADHPINWLVEYDGSSPPAAPAWRAQGSPQFAISDLALHLRDDSPERDGSFRAAWTPDPTMEVIVEAIVRVGSTGGVAKSKPTSRAVWPWRDGAPVSVLVSDGRHYDGLVLYSDRLATFTDRFYRCDTSDKDHTYRLVIHGNDMSVAVDGKVVVRGQNAFWKPAPSAEAFVQFGSNSQKATGDAHWKSVRLGVRKPSGPPPSNAIKLKLSEPWPIARPDLKIKPTRPYVYNVGNGTLLMSVAEGPDAIHEPYGVMRSDDEGKTWKPVSGLDNTEYAMLPMLRLKDGAVLGASRWTWVQPDRSLIGRSARWQPDLTNYEIVESRLKLPIEYSAVSTPLTCERQLFEQPDGSVLMSAYSKTGPATPEATRIGKRYSHLLRTTDRGENWQHWSVIGIGGEPAVVRTGGNRMTAVTRSGGLLSFMQTFSDDGGQTWTKPVTLEEGSVCPDLLMMSNGVLACSYG
ncbi:MAG TPA: sialidase family protein, partial [Pirellulales bacterium]|nr:sialidase family protein [Pirellulales bacterium]